MNFTATGFNELDAWLRRKLQDLGHVRPLLDSVGMMLLRSVHKNFRQGGRPTKWKPSLRARGQGRKTGKRQSAMGQTLRDTGKLYNSITYEISPPTVTVGTNVDYAPILHFGFDGYVTVKAHVRKQKSRNTRASKRKGRGKSSGVAFVKEHQRHMKIVARPFLLIQPEDHAGIKRRCQAYLATGKVPK